ncbi:cytochrome P450 [Irpex lacteus]|nr:cytochrome P450 [Irpex lacteus]
MTLPLLPPSTHPLIDALASIGVSLALLAVVQRILHTYSFQFSTSSRKSKLPYPPGPRGLPVVGNVHQLPKEYQERTFAEWRKTYGDLVFLRIFHTPAIIITSVAVARDLLEKRSANYSDRPPLTMLNDMMGWSNVVTHFPTGPRFRLHRRWIQAGIQDRDVLRSYRGVQEREAGVFLESLLDSAQCEGEGDMVVEGVKRYAAAILTHIAYGHTLCPGLTDPLLELADRATTETVRAGSPGSNPLGALVEFYPGLKNYPLWLPGSSFRTKLEEVRVLVRRMMDVPYEMVKAQYTAGTATPCLTTTLLEDHLATRGHDVGRLTPEEEEDIKGVAAVLYAAGTDTSIAVMTSFLMHMTLHPHIFKKAQQEMDRVVGRERLPTWEDREGLGYLECVFREVLRCTSPAPLGIPHATAKEDIYKGYVIPKGSMVIVNIWYVHVGMLHDPETYPNPEKFVPERYEGLSREELERVDPRGIVFGFGRRRCPGEQLADASAFLLMAYIVATMDISPGKDADGKELWPSGEFHSGFVLHPKPFKCSIRPRGEKAVQMIRQMSVLSSQ